MTNATEEFFADLASRGHVPALGKAKGTIRFDLKGERTTRWLVTIADGDVEVSRKSGKADCVVRADRALFDRIASGQANAFAAVLRGAMELDGDRGLLLPFQRLFTGPQE